MEYMISTAILAIATLVMLFSNIRLRSTLADVRRESALKQLELERKVDKYREKYLWAESQRDNERAAYRESLSQKGKDPSYNRLRELSGQRPLPSTGVTAGTRTTHQVDNGPDLLTQMIILDALNSPTGTAAGTVTYDEQDRPTINRIDVETSTPSSSSSSIDDSSSRSSYSSSSSDSYSSSDSSSSSSFD